MQKELCLNCKRPTTKPFVQSNINIVCSIEILVQTLQVLFTIILKRGYQY
jgi:hypothetical protein